MGWTVRLPFTCCFFIVLSRDSCGSLFVVLGVCGSSFGSRGLASYQALGLGKKDGKLFWPCGCFAILCGIWTERNAHIFRDYFLHLHLHLLWDRVTYFALQWVPLSLLLLFFF